MIHKYTLRKLTLSLFIFYAIYLGNLPARSALSFFQFRAPLVARAKKLETELKREEKEEESFPVRPLLSFPSARAAKGAHRRVARVT